MGLEDDEARSVEDDGWRVEKRSVRGIGFGGNGILGRMILEIRNIKTWKIPRLSEGSQNHPELEMRFLLR